MLMIRQLIKGNVNEELVSHYSSWMRMQHVQSVQNTKELKVMELNVGIMIVLIVKKFKLMDNVLNVQTTLEHRVSTMKNVMLTNAHIQKCKRLILMERVRIVNHIPKLTTTLIHVRHTHVVWEKYTQNWENVISVKNMKEPKTEIQNVQLMSVLLDKLY